MVVVVVVWEGAVGCVGGRETVVSSTWVARQRLHVHRSAFCASVALGAEESARIGRVKARWLIVAGRWK